MKRPNWEDIAAKVVEAYSQRSTCIHYKVAAAFFREDRLLVVGYNGPPRGEPHCTEIGCAKEAGGRCRGAHAEINGLVNAATEGINLKNCWVLCSYSPCLECAKHLVNLEITKFIYLHNYPKKELTDRKHKQETEEVKKLFTRHKIELKKYKKQENNNS